MSRKITELNQFRYNIAETLCAIVGSVDFELRCECCKLNHSRFDRVSILKEIHDPMVTATRRVLSALKA